ncbi:hypothetical protein MMC07_006011 [Pseudocyphellaria aurata]|nr:hypothetical protein [Pseudocyphellaria aurata]
MEQLKDSSSSKVKVEYHDPSGIFPLFSNELQQRLPLRNLHWNSPSRPLRSICSLHVDLVPADGQKLHGASFYHSSEDVVSTKINSTIGDAVIDVQQGKHNLQGTEFKKERRHQIPGLRQTPYLKIYLLRCDDTEAYKSVSRKLLRDWVKEHTHPSQSSNSISKGENHDAYEWLIIHVLPPNKDAADGPRSSGSPGGDSRADRGSSGTRWSARGSSTVIEKIRSDFCSASKTAVDRVAQIHLGQDLRAAGVTRFSNVSSDQQLSDERKGWNDLVSKFKCLILASFDLRVSQYEDDIKEKESQRSLPGWNFNTFFVLKEGLAKGFESVGLIEDALTVYHELAAALNAIVDQENPNVTTRGQTSHFRESTDDIWEEFQKAGSAVQDGLQYPNNTASGVNLQTQPINGSFHDFGALILDTNKKPYREMILGNNISAYDFLSYVFARQVSLLLRLANVVYLQDSSLNGRTGDIEPNKSELWPKSTGPRPDAIEEEAENLLILSNVCQHAVEFISSVTHIIRNDLRSSIEERAQAHEGMSKLPETLCNDIVENLVASWIFSVSQCILGKTSTQALSTQLQPLLRQFKSVGGGLATLENDFADTTMILQREDFPTRTSSLFSVTSKLAESPGQAELPVVTSLDALRLLPPGSAQTGSHELASQRAELSCLSRRALCDLGLRFNLWKGHWKELGSTQSSSNDMVEISLRGAGEDRQKSPEESSMTARACSLVGLRNRALNSALISKSAFYAAYEHLTASILALYVLGKRQNSAEVMTADIAAVRYDTGDYSVAASYFHQLTPYYAKDDWRCLETSMLNMYAECLKNMSRIEEYIHVGLKLVAKLVHEKEAPFSIRPNNRSKPLSLNILISASKSLRRPISVSMNKYFRNITVDPYLHHCKDHDGFQLQLRLRNCTLETIEAEQIQAQIVSMEDEHRSELWLTAEGFHVLEPGVVDILLGTKVMIPAWYLLNQILIRSENIIFTQNFSLFQSDLPKNTVSTDPSESISQLRILVWPLPKALEARLVQHKKIHLEQHRSVEIEVSTGWNHISQGKILLRAGSAGLRLHTADALLVSGNTTIVDLSQTGNIGFGELHLNTTMILRIPYDVESDLKEISVKIEVSYKTVKGDFIYACNLKVLGLLPLGVNVQDTFHEDALFSKFTISTANSIPLRISKCYVEDSLDFNVSSPSLTDVKLDVFSRQPLSLMSKIRQKQRNGRTHEISRPAQATLLLNIEYRCLDQEVYETFEQCFTKALAASNLGCFIRLLVPLVLAKARSKLSIQELEMIGTRRKITLATILDIDWSIILSGIRPELHQELARWLTEWQEKNATIPLLEDSKASKLQYLTVPVDIPQMGVVHTVCLQLDRDYQNIPADMGYVAVAQPLSAQLVIKHTRQWFTQAEPQPKNKVLEFCYEVQANPDTWLIGGHRKAHFSAEENEILRFPLLLIPQRTEQLTSGKPSYSSETDYRSQSETLLVVPYLRSTTVALDSSHSVSGTWLVDSKAGGRK